MICHDTGPLDAKIMIIGEAPGKEEEKEGIPFIGRSGKLLRSMCFAVGIDFDRCYVTNICSSRPPNNNFGYFYEDTKRSIPKDSLAQAWFRLKDKIKRIHPEVVICLGEEPLRAVTNLRGIGAWRGTRIEAYDTKVIATYHPSVILRDFARRGKAGEKNQMAYRKILTEMDLRKAKRESEGLVYRKPEIVISPTIDDVVGWFDDVESRSRSRVGFDIETLGRTVRSIAFAKEKKDGSLSGISIPFTRMIQSSPLSIIQSSSGMLRTKGGGGGDINYWEKSDEEMVLEIIARVMEDEKIEKVGQNSIHFDSPLIENEFEIKTINHKMDTMHAFHVLYPALPKGLSFISSVVTDHPNYWTLHDSHIDVSEWEYNAMDAIVTLEISRKVDCELEEEGLVDLYYKHVHPLSFALLDAQKSGVVFDVVRAKEMKKRLNGKLSEITKQMSALVGMDFNPGSPKQVKDLLYKTLGFPVIYHHHTKKPTTDEDAIRRLHAKYPDEPVLDLIIQHRKTSKLLSTYVDVKLDPDGRIRCSYDVSGTKTGRISSSKTLFGTGMDLHNIPKGDTRGSESTRHLYKASKGHLFVAGDLKQAEAMVVAWLLMSLGDRTLYELYQDPTFDIHRWCAANFVYLIPEEKVTKIQRNQGGKLANHSGNYMAGPGVMEKRARQMGWDGFTYRFCKEILQRRVNGIPGLRLWWADVEQKIQSTRTLYTCFGRRLQFFGRLEGEELRSAIAFEPQSTVGDVGNKIFLEMSHEDHLYRPLLTTHDEVVVETKKENVDLVVRKLREVSNIKLHLRPNIPALVIPIEITVGPNWGETVSYEEYKSKQKNIRT